MPALTGMNLIERETLGGWHVSGIVNIQSGMPFTVAMSSSATAAGVDQGLQRPSWVHAERANCNLKNAYVGLSHSTASCIDETAYKTAVNYSTGLSATAMSIETASLVRGCSMRTWLSSRIFPSGSG